MLPPLPAELVVAERVGRDDEEMFCFFAGGRSSSFCLACVDTDGAAGAALTALAMDAACTVSGESPPVWESVREDLDDFCLLFFDGMATLRSWGVMGSCIGDRGAWDELELCV